MYELPKILAAMVEREGSQTAIWEKARVDSGYFSRALEGVKVPKRRFIEDLCKAFPDDAEALKAAAKKDAAMEAGRKAEAPWPAAKPIPQKVDAKALRVLFRTIEAAPWIVPALVVSAASMAKAVEDQSTDAERRPKTG